MTFSLKHAFQSTKPDGADTSVVRPSDWNAEHQLSGSLPVTNGGTGTSTAFAAGSVVISGSGGTYTEDSGLYYSAGSKSLGVGTTTPGQTIEAFKA